ncbi:MAG TPA: OmpA family protein [Ferruginibacter sp.]|nr:OmpA family protein [Ferruginibacter sp.]
MNLFGQLLLLAFLANCLPVSAQVNSNNKTTAQVINRLAKPKFKVTKDTVAIPFEYRQSALYHPFTLEVIDSVINILLKKDSVTLSIEGYAHMGEGSDSICYYLSLNRALFVRDYVLGRGVDSTRIISLIGFGKTKPYYRKISTDKVNYNCRVEIMLNHPLPFSKDDIPDRDKDGIADAEDKCPDEYGERILEGCPNKDVVIVPFENQQSFLPGMAYKVLDSVVSVLGQNPSYTVLIEGHAYKDEGPNPICQSLAKERAEIVKNYLLSRMISSSRIEAVKNAGASRPINAGNNNQEIMRNSRTEITFSRH